MSCFKIPQQTIAELTSVVSQFWWDTLPTTKGIPWLAWQRMQFPKSQGGLGFKNLGKFNNAWRLVSYPNSPLAKLLKVCYYRDTHLLHAKTKKYEKSYEPYELFIAARREN